MFIQLGYASIEETNKLSERYGKALIFVQDFEVLKKVVKSSATNDKVTVVVSGSDVDSVRLQGVGLVVVYPNQEEALRGCVKTIEKSLSPIMFMEHPGVLPVSLKETEYKWIRDVKDRLILYHNSDWQTLLHLSSDFMFASNNSRAYDLAKEGLLICPEEKKHKFYEKIGVVSYYLGSLQEGYEACETVVFSKHCSYRERCLSLRNQGFYLSPIKFQEIIVVPFDVAQGFNGTNPSMIPNSEGGYTYNLRGVNYEIDAPQPPLIITKNYVLKLDKNLSVISGKELVDNTKKECASKTRVKGLEDVRLISDGKFFCNCVEVRGTPMISYGEYDVNTYHVTKLEAIKTNDGTWRDCEKNWLPFVVDGQIYFIYELSPLTIYKFDPSTTTASTHLKVEGESIGELRGSAQPIRYKNGWLGTSHQVYTAEGYAKRQYFHRFFWISDDFRELKLGRLFYFEYKGIEFSLSLCHSEKGLLVCYSRQDKVARVGVLSYKNLDEMLENKI